LHLPHTSTWFTSRLPLHFVHTRLHHGCRALTLSHVLHRISRYAPHVHLTFWFGSAFVLRRGYTYVYRYAAVLTVRFTYYWFGSVPHCPTPRFISFFGLSKFSCTASPFTRFGCGSLVGLHRFFTPLVVTVHRFTFHGSFSWIRLVQVPFGFTAHKLRFGSLSAHRGCGSRGSHWVHVLPPRRFHLLTVPLLVHATTTALSPTFLVYRVPHLLTFVLRLVAFPLQFPYTFLSFSGSHTHFAVSHSHFGSCYTIHTHVSVYSFVWFTLVPFYVHCTCWFTLLYFRTLYVYHTFTLFTLFGFSFTATSRVSHTTFGSSHTRSWTLVLLDRFTHTCTRALRTHCTRFLCTARLLSLFGWFPLFTATPVGSRLGLVGFISHTPKFIPRTPHFTLTTFSHISHTSTFHHTTSHVSHVLSSGRVFPLHSLHGWFWFKFTHGCTFTHLGLTLPSLRFTAHGFLVHHAPLCLTYSAFFTSHLFTHTFTGFVRVHLSPLPAFFRAGSRTRWVFAPHTLTLLPHPALCLGSRAAGLRFPPCTRSLVYAFVGFLVAVHYLLSHFRFAAHRTPLTYVFTTHVLPHIGLLISFARFTTAPHFWVYSFVHTPLRRSLVCFWLHWIWFGLRPRFIPLAVLSFSRLGFTSPGSYTRWVTHARVHCTWFACTLWTRFAYAFCWRSLFFRAGCGSYLLTA